MGRLGHGMGHGKLDLLEGKNMGCINVYNIYNMIFFLETTAGCRNDLFFNPKWNEMT